MIHGVNFVHLPSYFSALNANPSVHCSAVNCFAQWYASVEGDRVKIVTSKECILDVIVYADRNDACCQGYQDVVDAPVEEELNGSDMV